MARKIAFIGLGKQNTKDHLKAAQSNESIEVVAVCDNTPEVAKEWGEAIGVPSFTSVDEMLANCSVDVAIVAVPHFAYLPIITSLAEAGVHILKEKPLAIDLDEAVQMAELARKHNINLSVAVQRKHSRLFQTYQEYAPRIGDLFSIHGEYTLNITDLAEGWRSSKKLSGGGAVIDMGYHLIDLITWYFGLPDRISADLGYHNYQDQDYDVEDTAKIQFSYNQGPRKILGSVLLSRIYPEKDESIFIYGTEGAIKIFKTKIELYDRDRELIESKFVKPDNTDITVQFDSFIKSLDDENDKGNYEEHLENMVFIDAIYQSDKDSKTVLPFTDTNYQGILKDKKSNPSPDKQHDNESSEEA